MLIQYLHIGTFGFAHYLSQFPPLCSYTVNLSYSTLHSKGAQGSVRCGPPETAPPALPGSEDTPDVVPPLYADLDTLKVHTCLFCSTVLSSESPVIVFH